MLSGGGLASLCKVEDEPARGLHHSGNDPGSGAPVPKETLSYRNLLRRMQPVLGPAVWTGGPGSALLEAGATADPPAIAMAWPIEPVVHPVLVEQGDTQIDAFLDGIQRTRIVTHVDGVPIVHGYAAAVVRVRHERRMQTWRDVRRSHALYVPRVAVGERLWTALDAEGVPLMDTSLADAIAHPLAYRRQALDRVAAERERLEQALVVDWSHAQDGWLWVDGGVSGIPAVATTDLDAARIFGVVKSHATLYGDTAMVAATLRLRESHRTPVFVIRHRLRAAVVSWYVRLRRSDSGDPLHGLLRVELLVPTSIANRLDDERSTDTAFVESVTRVANRISGWILAERLPLSLPDARWDRLTYGVHDCEQFLAALPG